MGNDRFAPVRVGEELDVKIEAVGEKGDGIAKKNGFVLFVPNTKQGDDVRIRVTRVLTKVGFAEAIGKAQGPVGSGYPERQAHRPKREEPPKEEIHIDESKDSEDFGDDAPSEDVEEEKSSEEDE
jgi:predicted RNA-binding protein with TRAM domain